MRNVLASLREFCLKVVRHAQALVVSVIGGLLGIADAVYAGFQKPTANKAAPPPFVPLWVWLSLIAAGFLVAMVWAFHDVRMERDAVQQRAAKAESDLENTRGELEKTRRERDDARRELEGARRAAFPASPEPKPPPFDLDYYPRKATFAGTPMTLHFVGVTNPAGQPERRVRMSAERMDPYPSKKSSRGTGPAFSHDVAPEGGGTPAAGLLIGPGQEKRWLIGRTWTGPDGKIRVIDFFDDTGADWELGPDENWRIYYRIACDGVPDRPFSVRIEVEEGSPVVRLEDPLPPD